MDFETFRSIAMGFLILFTLATIIVAWLAFTNS